MDLSLNNFTVSNSEIIMNFAWSDCVKADMNACSIGGIDPQNKTVLRSGIRIVSPLLPVPATGTNRSS